MATQATLNKNKDIFKRRIESLVTKFENFESHYTHEKYKEENVKTEFINPMFASLGWDISNESGLNPFLKEVVFEDNVLIDGRWKHPDYSFNHKKKRLFFIDAKKPNIDLKNHRESAKQIRLYGWNGSVPIAVLTDFEEFAIYDCTVEPKHDESASIARIEHIKYDKYYNQLDYIYEYFAKENVINGSLERLNKSDVHKKGTQTVDKRFLASLDKWRSSLAVSIHRNNSVNTDMLNYLVQQLIDRIIFLRICESRNVEKFYKLRDVVGEKDCYQKLLKYFKEADQKYNSGLFDFTKDLYSFKINIDDATLNTIILELYYPLSPYLFSVIPVEIIGNAYEQFLGNEIRIESNKVIVEQKPEVRKAGGVYYTPQYIVNYIVENTVGKLIVGKTPDQIAKIKILDPSCGSGSFLLGAYEYLLDYHLNYYWRNRKKLKSVPIGEDGKLSTAEKKRILNNNIFGVDLDERAVEIAKLSLLLKVLEDETNETLKDEKLLGFKEKVLPNLDMNIKCGNSLIGSDFKKVTPSVSKAEIEEIKPFDWQVMFPQVFKQGGFDCVIGNPPYGALFNEQSKKYLRSKFETFMGRGESYVVFIEKILSLLNNNGLLGCIIPDTYLNLEFTRPIRNLLLCSTKLKEVVVLPSTIFADATVDTTILITEKAKRIESFYKTDVTIKVFQKKEFLINLHNPLKEFETSTQKWFETNSFNVSSNGIDLDLIQKIDNNFPKLDTIAEMFSGIKAYEVGKGSPPQTAKIRDEKPFTSEKQKSAKWLPSYDGKHIGRYEIFWKSNNWIHYGQWLAAPRNSQNFENEKILIRKIIGKTLIATYVEETSYCNTLLFILKLKKDIKIDYEFVLGVLNSTFIGWYFRKKFQIAKEDTFPQIMIRDILQFAFPTKSSKKLNDKLVSLVKEMIQLKVDIAKATSSKIIDKLETEFKYKDDSINNLVYELYGLTKEEIEVIEND